MLSLFQIRQGATAPFLEVVLTQRGEVSMSSSPPAIGCGSANQGTFDPINLTEATEVKARMWKCGRIKAEKALLGVTEVVDATNGVVRYKWALSDTDTAGGYYFAFEVTFSDGSKLIWPYVAELFPIEITE